MRDKFLDSHSAIRAACELEGGAARPLTSRMLDKKIAGGGSWEDAALRAGLIWQALQPLRGVPIAILVARATPRFTICSCRRPCCSSRKPHPYWIEAIDILAAGALSAGLAARRYDERKALLLRIFGEPLSFEAIAAATNIERHTISKHLREFETWIGIRSADGIEAKARSEAEKLLWTAGMIEEDASEN